MKNFIKIQSSNFCDFWAFQFYWKRCLWHCTKFWLIEAMKMHSQTWLRVKILLVWLSIFTSNSILSNYIAKKLNRTPTKIGKKRFNLLLNISSRICIHSITNKLQKKIAFIIYTTFYIFKLIRQCSRPHIICIWKSIKSFFLHIMI